MICAYMCVSLCRIHFNAFETVAIQMHPPIHLRKTFSFFSLNNRLSFSELFIGSGFNHYQDFFQQ